MFLIYIMCLCVLPMLDVNRCLNYFVYYIIKMSESVQNNAETPIGDDMDQG